MDNILALDGAVYNFLFSARNPLGIDIFSIISFLGNWKIILPATVLIGGVFWLRQKRDYILPFFMTVAGSQIFEFILKRIIQRPRPLSGVYPEGSFSFPSGHAVVVIGFFGFLMYLALKNIKKRKDRAAVWIFGALVILLVGFSRLYLGVHYFSDVIGGYLLGAIWLAIGIYIHQKNLNKPQ